MPNLFRTVAEQDFMFRFIETCKLGKAQEVLGEGRLIKLAGHRLDAIIIAYGFIVASARNKHFPVTSPGNAVVAFAGPPLGLFRSHRNAGAVNLQKHFFSMVRIRLLDLLERNRLRVAGETRHGCATLSDGARRRTDHGVCRRFGQIQERPGVRRLDRSDTTAAQHRRQGETG